MPSTRCERRRASTRGRSSATTRSAGRGSACRSASRGAAAGGAPRPTPRARCGRSAGWAPRWRASSTGSTAGCSAVLGSAQFERLLAAVHAHSWQLDAPEHDDDDEGGGGGGSPAFEGRAWFDVLGSVPAAAQPNCALALVHGGGPLRATLTALRDIAPGEGLTIGV